MKYRVFNKGVSLADMGIEAQLDRIPTDAFAGSLDAVLSEFLGQIAEQMMTTEQESWQIVSHDMTFIPPHVIWTVVVGTNG